VKAALLVIYIQKAYATDEGTSRSYAAAAEHIVAAADLFRKRGHAVVSIYHHGKEDGPHPGDPLYEFADEVRIGKPDVVIHKAEGNAFYDTDLADQLRALGVEIVVVTGFCAEHCVLDTYRGAEERGFIPMFLQGALASRSRKAIDFVEKLGSLLSIGALQAFLPELIINPED
jgi:nicotinamidase-related amidase